MTIHARTITQAQTFTYTLDALERPTGLSSDVPNMRWASGVTYNAANQMTYDGQQTWTYNNLLQATRVTGCVFRRCE